MTDYHPEPARRRSGITILAVAALALLILIGIAGAILLFRSNDQGAQLRQLQATIRSDQAAVLQDQAHITGLSSQVTALSSQLSSLNIPTDPLSAYNAICDQTMTNNNTGLSGLWFFPCTNQATTIPQPSAGN